MIEYSDGANVSASGGPLLSLSSPAGLFWLSGAYVNEQNSFVFAGNGQTVDDVEASSMGVLTATNFSSDPEVKKNAIYV